MMHRLKILLQEGFTRVSVDNEVYSLEDLVNIRFSGYNCDSVCLVIDRIVIHHSDEEQVGRIADSVQTTFFEGDGSCIVEVVDTDSNKRYNFSNRFEADGITFEKPNPNFFSFNNPYGACQTCQGYGNVIGIDEDLVVPNKKLSIYEGAIACWKGDKMREWKQKLILRSTKMDIPIHKPYNQLTDEQRKKLWNGDENFPGIYAFFEWLESQSYKIQYRVMLSRYRGKTVCPDCKGTRLRKDAGYVKICDKSIIDLVLMPISELYEFINNIKLTPYDEEVVQRIMIELRNRLKYLLDVGLGYLNLNRLSNTLSGGESQRINLATSLGSSLVGSTYILDEPSIGLHPRDTDRLIKVLKQLRDLGNTVVVVEHDEEIIRAADYIIDIGPYAGRIGGEVVFEGTIDNLLNKKTNSLTAAYLKGEERIEVPKQRRKSKAHITIEGAWENNLKNIDVKIPLQKLVVVTGVSGSGKTSLIKNVLYDVLHKQFDGYPEYVGKCYGIKGNLSKISGVELVDQNPIGRSTRSNPASYTKAFDEIRHLYSMQPLAKARGYKAGFFSFNVEGGRCDVCQGEGTVTIGMQFMADVHLVCEECGGSRFKVEALEVLYKGLNINEILDMTIDKAIEFFSADSSTINNRIVERLQPLQDVGLGYLKMGQPSTTLSGGEAQRIKLATYLIKGATTEPQLFIFDEPSTGLHFHDIKKLLKTFDTLISNGHSIVVIEHHPDIIKTADWVIDLGPEGGKEGGKIVFEGTPEDLVQCPNSYTGKCLKGKL